jgi:hypothetical protein
MGDASCRLKTDWCSNRKGELMKSRIMAAGLLTWTLLQACSQGSDVSEPSLLMGDETATELGQGRNSLTGLAAGNCLDEVQSTPVQRTGAVPFVQFIQDKSQLADALKLSISELNAGAAGSPLAQLAQSVTPQPRLTHLLITLKRVTQEQKISSLTLKQNALQLYKTNYASFVRTCGDSFVASMEMGDALYGIVPIIVESEEHKQQIQKDIQAISLDPNKVFEKLKTYGTLPVPVLYWGDASPSSQPLPAFHAEFNSMHTGVKPIQSKKINQEYREYRVELTDAPDAAQYKRLAYVKAYAELGKKLLRTELCQERIQRALANPVEFSEPVAASLADFEESAAQQYDAIGQTMENCVVDACRNGVCEINQCSLPASLNELVENCEKQGPQILPTDPVIYSRWVEANGAWGEMLQLSQTIGGTRVQDFGNGYRIRPEFATSQQVFPMERDVFQKWQNHRAQLQAPLAKAPYPTGAAIVTDFAGGRIFKTAGAVYYVNRLAPYLNGALPTADEQQNNRNPADVWAQLSISNGQTLYYRAANTVTRLSNSALINFHRGKGGLNWGVPVVAEENGSYGAAYFKASDANYYWDSHGHGVRTLNEGLSKLFKRMGRDRAGLPTGDFSCQNNICSANFEKGRLSVYQDSGARVCGNQERENSYGECVKFDIADICRFTTICRPVERVPIRIPRIPPIEKILVIRF